MQQDCKIKVYYSLMDAQVTVFLQNKINEIRKTGFSIGIEWPNKNPAT
jgi:hypothetical protein